MYYSFKLLNRKSQSFRKKVMIFTAQDDPNGNKPSLQEDAVTKFKDLGEVDLTVVAFKEDFQYAKFYSVRDILNLVFGA